MNLSHLLCLFLKTVLGFVRIYKIYLEEKLVYYWDHVCPSNDMGFPKIFKMTFIL